MLVTPALAQKSQYLKYPLGAAAEPPRRPPDLRQRFPGAYVGRRCKRGQNLAPQNTRRGCLKDPTRTTKNEPNTTATLTRTALPLLLGSGPSPFEATRQPSSGRPGIEDPRPNPLRPPITLTLTLTI